MHFDFDRYTLRAEATRVLDDAIKAMQADNTLRLTVEGHTCNIGTTEYNLALGERRAAAVRDTSRAAASAPTVSRPSATVKSVRSTTTAAKRRAA